MARTGQAETQSSQPLHFSASNKTLKDSFQKPALPWDKKRCRRHSERIYQRFGLRFWTEALL